MPGLKVPSIIGLRLRINLRYPLLQLLTRDDGAERWMKPSIGVVKINVDAALFPDQGRFSFAYIARNDQGQAIEAITCCKQGAEPPEMAEAMGVKEDLSWIKRKM